MPDLPTFHQIVQAHIQTTQSVYSLDHAPKAPDGINDGWCDVWAERFAALIGSTAEVLRTTHGEHYWVKVGERHYDSECCAGVSDWRNLPVIRMLAFHQPIEFDDKFKASPTACGGRTPSGQPKH